MESRRDKEMEDIKAAFANDNEDLSFSSYVDYYGHNFDDLKDVDVFACDDFKYQFAYFFLIQHFMQNPFEKDKMDIMNEGKLGINYFEFATLKKLALNNGHWKYQIMQETRSNISNSRQNKTKRLSPVNQKKNHNLVINYSYRDPGSVEISRSCRFES